MREAIGRLFSAAEKDAPGDDEYMGMVANCALVLVGARRGARLDMGLKRDGHLWGELMSVRGHKLIAWDDSEASTWTEPIFVPVKHASDAKAMKGSNSNNSAKAWRDMGRLLGYPEWCGRGGADRRTAVLKARVQRGLSSGPAVFLAGVKCSEANLKKAGDLLQSWADKGNKAMSGEICGLGIRVHFFASLV